MFIECECGNKDRLGLDEYGLVITVENKFDIEVNSHSVALEIRCKKCGKELKEG